MKKYKKFAMVVLVIMGLVFVSGCANDVGQEQVKQDINSLSYFSNGYSISKCDIVSVGDIYKNNSGQKVQDIICQVDGENEDIEASLNFNMKYVYDRGTWTNEFISVNKEKCSVKPKKNPDDTLISNQVIDILSQQSRDNAIEIEYPDVTITDIKDISDTKKELAIQRSFDNTIASGSEEYMFDASFEYEIDDVNESVYYDWDLTITNAEPKRTFMYKIDLFKLKRTIQARAGYYNTYAVLKNDGSFWMWGRTMIKAFQTEPVKVWDNVKEFSMSWDTNVLLVDNNGTAYGWGRNDAHQLAQPTAYYADWDTTKPIKLKDNIKSVSAGAVDGGETSGYSLLLDTSNNLWGAGTSGHDVCGIGNDILDIKEFTQTVKNLDSVVAGENNVYALRGTDLLSWGENKLIRDKQPAVIMNNIKKITGEFDYVIDNDNTLYVVPGILGTDAKKMLENVADYREGVNADAVLCLDGSLWIKGKNLHYCMGDVIEKDDYSNEWLKIMDNVVQFDLDGYAGMALKSDGTLWMWGDNSDGCIDPTNGKQDVATPKKVMDNVSLGI